MSTSPIFEPTFEEELALEQGQFREILQKYPQFASRIFGLTLAYIIPSLEDLRFFQANGVDLDKTEKYLYPSDADYSTALHYACECRNLDLIQVLIEAGVDIQKKIPFGEQSQNTLYTPIESVLVGHGYRDRLASEETEKCIKFLIEHGAEVRQVDPNGLIQECIEDFKKTKEEWDALQRKDFPSPWSEYLYNLCRRI